jgi:hypothetical protein
MRTKSALAVIDPALNFAGAAIAFAPQSMAQAPAPETTPAPQTPQTKPGDNPNEPLSKKLDKHEGVLKPPPGVDPEMHKQPPATTGDKMPIIVPPGEPEGDQSVQPK